jgi:3-oxoacyl-[acyl-carrier protein] reductase
MTGAQMVADHVADFTTWLCTDDASNINGMCFRVMRGEIGLMADPHVTRSVFREGRWDIASLNDPAVAGYLYRDLKNRFGSQ